MYPYLVYQPALPIDTYIYLSPLDKTAKPTYLCPSSTLEAEAKNKTCCATHTPSNIKVACILNDCVHVFFSPCVVLAAYRFVPQWLVPFTFLLFFFCYFFSSSSYFVTFRVVNYRPLIPQHFRFCFHQTTLRTWLIKGHSHFLLDYLLLPKAYNLLPYIEKKQLHGWKPGPSCHDLPVGVYSVPVATAANPAKPYDLQRPRIEPRTRPESRPFNLGMSWMQKADMAVNRHCTRHSGLVI